MIRPLFLLAALSALPILSGCTPLGLAAGAGATAGVATQQEGGLNTAANDTWIRGQINQLWFEHDIDMMRRVGLSVSAGRVLLTGVVPKAEDRVDAVRLVWRVQGVREVINEIKVDGEAGTSGGSYATDVWISTQLRSKLLFDNQIKAINYSVETIHGIVYLMGIAQNEPELERVINHARNVPSVNRVVSHVMLRSDSRLRTPANSPAPAADPAPSAPAASPEPVRQLPATQSAPVERVPLQ
ncbi:BON domain-containing protein [Oceanibaculum pacificum]|uniref:Phospholipid-binding domain-containing protein n=1 Tax=Oceanibaculum pacificum TaxID=580166 RepID=A0A154WH19_9PROT|nr:BON domain-containing protein [Oceanibaculum pacificum]KZD12786.1 phospholipid-binding domain-containing protein [Oceanibaculum pacificum]